MLSTLRYNNNLQTLNQQSSRSKNRSFPIQTMQDIFLSII